jgi:hypothetical protein
MDGGSGIWCANVKWSSRYLKSIFIQTWFDDPSTVHDRACKSLTGLDDFSMDGR